MFILKPTRSANYNKCAYYCILQVRNSAVLDIQIEKYKENNDNSEDPQHPKVLYNSVIEQKYKKLGCRGKLADIKEKIIKSRVQNVLANQHPLPLTLKYFTEIQLNQKIQEQTQTEISNCTDTFGKTVNFPYSHSYTVGEQQIEKEEKVDNNHESVSEEIRKRYQLMTNTKDWMTSYDNFEDDLVETETSMGLEDWKINYGTPNPNSAISNTPCGGCGALLHCNDTAIPGYLPWEIFKNYNKKGATSLEGLICQRCYFLKEYNIALQVQVSPKDYPKILMRIRDKKALVVLLVDLLDFPCSIWPGIADILGSKIPIFVAGNKIDLLPREKYKFVTNVKSRLLDELRLNGFGSSNILGVELISAKTGYGVEEFITALHSKWKYKGDVYLVGCTNVGKSSLFNALLQSDYCKVQATDLIQRATTSQWPGTTLNLLKFPILRPSRHRLFLRHQRMQIYKKVATAEKHSREMQLKNENCSKYATLIGHIGHTFTKNELLAEKLPQDSVIANISGELKMGIDEKHSDYALSKWCYDTPGVVQPDQILNILTIDELLYTIPKELIRPETFCVKPSTTLFIAGLARLDFLEGPTSIRLTVFRSNELPVTICTLDKADEVYQEYLGTKYFKVPISETGRLSKWPGLESSKPVTITGIDNMHSCKDIVLSSAGWVAINCRHGLNYKFQAWTPERRGIYVRDALLPMAVTLRGPRIRHSVAYKEHRFI